MKANLSVFIGVTFVYGAAVIPAAAAGAPPRGSSERPNIVLILADDLGYGDIRCYNNQSKVDTPHVDQLASEGMRFLDAHSPSTVCTPSRYSLLTGRMCFRTGYRGVFSGVGGPALIEEDRLTLPQMLRDRGYATACIGKWHLGMTFLTKDGQPAYDAAVPDKRPADWRQGGPALERVRLVDFSRPITDGPIHRGFDRFFGTACCPTTDWLYAWIDQDRVPTPPKAQLDQSALPRHPYSYDNRRGLIASDYDLETVDLVFLDHSQKFLRRHVTEHPERPFFLFHSMQAVHLPSFAAPEFRNSTKAGPHGDFIFEMDHVVGQLLATLEQLNLTDNTLVMFASDNGPEVTTVVHMRDDHQHDGARPWRGMKRDQWEGGHRTPFIVRWPGRIPASRTCDQMFSLTDIMATCAAVSGAELPEDAAEDSFNFLPVWLGEQIEPVRDYLLSQTISLALAIRHGPWKLLDHKGSGGNNYSRPPLDRFDIPDTAPEADGQLYDLRNDPGETQNLYTQHPDIAARLKAKLTEFRQSGRSAPAGQRTFR
ncbi:MAG: sulfatase-like hydrolase/transferase [Fuerstiella sp.]